MTESATTPGPSHLGLAHDDLADLLSRDCKLYRVIVVRLGV